MDKTLSKFIAATRTRAFEARRLRELHKSPTATPQTKSPGIAEMVVSASGSLTKWVGSGLLTSTPEVIDSRLGICKKCDFWSATALKNTGRCRKCGCSTWAKLRLPTEKCPLDKWGPVNTSTPELQQPSTD